MDVKVEYQVLQTAISALGPAYSSFLGCSQTLSSVQADIEAGIWTGETANHFIERLTADIKFVDTYCNLLADFDAALRQTLQVMKEADGKAKQSIPSV